MGTSTAEFALEGNSLPDDVSVVGYEAFEAISRPYEVRVDFYTRDGAFDGGACLRKPLLLTITDELGQTRRIHGIAFEAEFVKVSGPRLYFRITLRPALLALALRENSRTFQKQSIVEIATQIFDEAGFGAQVEWQLTGHYEPQDFVVQYRESELNFITRRFEDLGIFYFFKHAADGHTLILGDDSDAAFEPMDDAPTVHFQMTQGVLAEASSLRDFRRTRSLRARVVRLRDFDFEKPQRRPEAEQQAREVGAMNHYAYPAGFTKVQDGEARARARMRQLRRDADTCQGTSRAMGLRCGVPFSVDGAFEPCLNGEFVVTELASKGKQDAESENENFACRNTFRGIPKGAPYAPPPDAQRPRIHGIQTAVVTGPSSDEQAIHTDRYGRLKVRFHWDRVSQRDDSSSDWVRVAQVPMSGAMILPRVGWEVSVCFLEGDPDRPLVLGRVYNGAQAPPYALPGAKASGSLKSLSSPGGGGHNEIVMSDSGGSQGYGVHAQKDFNLTIGHDLTEKILANESHAVHTNINTTVGSNDTIAIAGQQSIDVGSVLSQKIGGSQSVTIAGSDTSNATANYVEKVGGDRSYTVAARQMVLQNSIKCTVTGDFTRNVGALQANASIASISDNILGSYNSKVGAATVHLVNGSHAETVGKGKNQLCGAAEIHIVKGSFSQSCDGPVKKLAGALVYEKIDGDYSVKAPSITLVGGVGVFKGGDSTFKLGGGPIVIKGSTIACESPMLIRMAGSLKLGPG